MMKMNEYVSKRGHPLVCQCVGEKPKITVENYCKWYRLQVLFPDGHIEELEYPEEEDLKSTVIARKSKDADWEVFTGHDSSYVDHVPNPRAVMKFAEKNGWDVCQRSLEMMIGRWEIEARDRFPDGSVPHETRNWIQI